MTTSIHLTAENDDYKGAASLWDDKIVEVVVYDAEDKSEANRTTQQVVDWIRNNQPRIERAIVDDLLGIYNGGYAQPDDGLPELDAAGFLASLPPRGLQVFVGPDEWSAELALDDAKELFWGHYVLVDVTSDGKVQALFQG